MDESDIKHNRQQIFQDRSKGISEVWRLLLRERLVNGEYFRLNRAILENAVRHYVNDLGILKVRYSIGDLAQSQKVAGLAAGAILRFRPVVPIDGTCEEKRIRDDTSNEILAVFHGMLVCADHYIRNYGIKRDVAAGFFKTARCKDWVNKNVYLLRERNHTPEALLMIFEGFCLAGFPDAIEKELNDINNN